MVRCIPYVYWQEGVVALTQIYLSNKPTFTQMSPGAEGPWWRLSNKETGIRGTIKLFP